LDSVLTRLKNRHEPLLNALLKKYRQYTACVGLLHTGYFKRFVRRDPPRNFQTLYRRGVFTNMPYFCRWLETSHVDET